MNEQIKELHKQAFDWVQYQLQIVGSDHPVTQKEQLDMVNQKFGELIVLECAGLAEDGFDDELDGQEICDRIKQYFGVK